jgi:two-component system alkaline phosphatase synthesis response regulator PhoP
MDSILVVDDDLNIVKVVRDYLEQAGFNVLVAYDGETALYAIYQEKPTLVILDLMLPHRNGWDVMRRVRSDEALRNIPIIMLTARVDDTDKILGLELGADDYITKPFNPREVVARVRTVLRRAYPEEVSLSMKALTVGPLSLNLASREITTPQGVFPLTPTEFKLLQALMTYPSFVLTRADLIEKAFGYTYDITDRTLDNHIRNLRKKVEPDPNNPTYIQTVYGVGYRLVETP